MDVTITKGKDADRVDIRRADGSTAQGHVPKKGPLPHDAVHYIVEDTLGLGRGFWGTIANGADPAAVQDIAKAAGHPSAKRAGVPEAAIHELLQAERIVEAVEAALWCGSDDAAGIRDMAQTGCDASHIAPPVLADHHLANILHRARALQDEWMPAPIGHAITFSWAAK